MAKKDTVGLIASILLIIGGLNWGLMGLGVGNVVNMIIGSIALLEMIIYVLVGVAALYALYGLVKK